MVKGTGRRDKALKNLSDIPESAMDLEFGRKRDKVKSKRSAPNDEPSPRWAG
jgi:hypothetical protein